MDAFVARQAVFDRNKNVFGYELLFRNCLVNSFDGANVGADESFATSQVISNSLLSIGWEQLLSGRRAFVNFGRHLLVQELPSVLPKELVIVEVLETVEPDPAVLEACRELKRKGYLIALDDFVAGGPSDALCQYADIIKVDFLRTPRPDQLELVKKYSRRGMKMLAEKLETLEEYDWAHSAGYDYFQGYFFAKPTILRVKQIPPSKINALRLLQELQKPDLEHHKLEALIKQDVSFSYKLLRYVNSAAFPFRNPIRSIQHALMVLGDDEIRRWTTLVALPGMAHDKPAETISHALVRARLCEQLGKLTSESLGEVDPFLMGMFSLLDAMIDRPLDDIVKELNLHKDMQDALLLQARCGNTSAAILRLVNAYERANWQHVEKEGRRLGISSSSIAVAYLDSLNWVDQLLMVTEAGEKKVG